ncbi:cell division protein DedD [Serratia proteamaculans]|uniref:cell division protein DedD n=1 Tax=Serratia proteamaculans TaxID=28151 RepID=UPI002177A62D|nr:cell division protein DedD [Serratia proteamaculans]CAI1994791.1 cell division protein DedD [Serratia proteamaculans]
MASKFQNRLVGTVILVALGVIILPGLLDGKKKHYEDEFAAIPLVPKAGDVEENDVVPPVSQPLPAQPPEGAGALVEQQAANEAAAQQAVRQPTLVTPPVETRPQPTPQPTPQPKPKPVEVKPKPVPQPKPVEVKPVVKPETRPEPKPEPTPVPKPEPAPVQKPAEEKAPAGQAYVVQLGALKNAAKVNEVVASLRLSGYRAFTVPSTPVQGQITRIYVGPDASKQKLQSSLSALNSISGLSGQVKPYGVR